MKSYKRKYPDSRQVDRVVGELRSGNSSRTHPCAFEDKIVYDLYGLGRTVTARAFAAFVLEYSSIA